MIDDQEQNRFVSKDELFMLHNDAIPEVLSWKTSVEKDIFQGSHSGYQRLNEPVTPVRKIVLEKTFHRLVVVDKFEGNDLHTVSVPFHFEPGFEIIQLMENAWHVKNQENVFRLVSPTMIDWSSTIKSGWVSPSYGVKLKRSVLEFSSVGALKTLAIGIFPENQMPDDIGKWFEEYLL